MYSSFSMFLSCSSRASHINFTSPVMTDVLLSSLGKTLWEEFCELAQRFRYTGDLDQLHPRFVAAGHFQNFNKDSRQLEVLLQKVAERPPEWGPQCRCSLPHFHTSCPVFFKFMLNKQLQKESPRTNHWKT